ncbi:MAG: DUF3251 domain-containing protein [Candidatus Malihini olakiniferum]
MMPLERNSIILQSNNGKLSLSLNHIELETNGTLALLYVRLLDKALPSFHAQLDYNQITRSAVEV